MSDEQQEHTGAGDRWGDPISDERKEELRQLFAKQQAWAATPEAERRGQASHFRHVGLTGADVAWLAKKSGPDAKGGVSDLHLERASLEGAHLETLYVNILYVSSKLYKP